MTGDDRGLHWFGTTFGETKWALSRQTLGATVQRRATAAEILHARARIVISVLLAMGALTLIGMNVGESQAIGAGILGTIGGYWLK